MDRIQLTLKYLHQYFDQSEYFQEHPDDKKYRLEHTLRVANIGKLIAEKEGFDVEGMIIACLLHDISYGNNLESKDDWLNHGRTSARIARPLVESFNLDKQLERDILYGIAIHVDDKADFEGEKTPFACSVGDADNIDRFDAYRIFDSLNYEKFGQMKLSDQIQLCKERIERLKKLLCMDFSTKTATELFHKKVSFQLEFYQRLLAQLNDSNEIHYVSNNP